jgi:hypothetical protein
MTRYALFLTLLFSLLTPTLPARENGSSRSGDFQSPTQNNFPTDTSPADGIDLAVLVPPLGLRPRPTATPLRILALTANHAPARESRCIIVMKILITLAAVATSFLLTSCSTGGGGLGGLGVPGFDESRSTRQVYDDRTDRRRDDYDDRQDYREDQRDQAEYDRQQELDRRAGRLNERSSYQRQTAAEQQRIADQQQERADRLRERQQQLQKEKQNN